MYVLLGLLHFFFRQHESEAIFLPTVSMTKRSIYKLLLAADDQKKQYPTLCLAFNTHWVQLQQKNFLQQVLLLNWETNVRRGEQKAQAV